jgi:hypothetical protein
MDEDFKRQIIAGAKPLIDKLNALSKEIGAAEEQAEKEKNEPSSGVKQWLKDEKSGLFKGKTLNGAKEEEFNETADFTGKKL